MTNGMLTLIGVGHVFDLRSRLKAEILARSPTLVCLELDRERFQSLLERSGSHATDAPLMYRLLARFQESIARQYGTGVGDEMLAAAEAARELRAGVAFIDLNSSEVFEEFWRSMSLKERVKLLLAAFGGLFTSRKTVEREVARFEESPTEYIEEFSREFPSAKRVLIDQRDEHMASRIRELSTRFERIVAVVGDGHIEGLRRMLADLNPEVVRLADLRRAPDATVAVEGATYTYTFR